MYPIGMMNKKQNGFISYAQNFEDVVLHRVLKDIGKGFYIDVGAYDPVKDSVTKAFYDIGWRGINIEPVSELYERLLRDRPDDVNLQFVVGTTDGEVTFYEIPETGLSTCNDTVAKRYRPESGIEIREKVVQSVSLTSVCEQYAAKEIHFLKIDVEGSEDAVLQGLDLKRFRPWIILVESISPHAHINSHSDWEPILLAANYKYIKFDGLNRFYVANEHKELGSSILIPPNVFDGFVLSGDGSSSFHAGVSEIRDSLHVVTKQCQQQEEQVKDLRARIGKCDDILLENENLIEQLNSENNAAMLQIDEMRHRNYQMSLSVDQLSHDLRTVYNSTSWRITQPLRMCMHLFKNACRFPHLGVNWIGRLPRRISCWIISKVKVFVLGRPRLKVALKKILKKNPALYMKLGRKDLGFNVTSRHDAEKYVCMDIPDHFNKQMHNASLESDLSDIESKLLEASNRWEIGKRLDV